MELEPEIINFATPKDDSTVLISNFSSKTSEDDLFEIFLLIVSIFEKERDFDGVMVLNRFAYVKYYSVRHAMNCVRLLRSQKIHGHVLNAKFPQKKKSVTEDKEKGLILDAQRDLTIDKCVELVHHFLGYNSWSSQIVEIAGLEFNQLEDGFYMSRFKCVVKLTFKGDSRFIEAEGIGEALEEDRCTAVDNSRKRAVTEARKNAFKKISIIYFPSNKSFLHIPNQPLPLFLFQTEKEEKESEVNLKKEENIIRKEEEGESDEAEGPVFKKQKVNPTRTFTVSHSY